MVSLSLHTKPLGNHSGFYFWLFLSFFEENNMWIGSFQSMIIKHPSDFHILSLLHCSAVRHRILILCYGLLSKNWSGWWIEWIGVNTPYILLWQLRRLRCQKPITKIHPFLMFGNGEGMKNVSYQNSEMGIGDYHSSNDQGREQKWWEKLDHKYSHNTACAMIVNC